MPYNPWPHPDIFSSNFPLIPFLPGSTDDYAPIPITRTFVSNSDSPLCFPMTVNDDSIVESDETFTITLSSADTLADRMGFVTIRDDDGN